MAMYFSNISKTVFVSIKQWVSYFPKTDTNETVISVQIYAGFKITVGLITTRSSFFFYKSQIPLFRYYTVYKTFGPLWKSKYIITLQTYVEEELKFPIL